MARCREARQSQQAYLCRWGDSHLLHKLVRHECLRKSGAAGRLQPPAACFGRPPSRGDRHRTQIGGRDAQRAAIPYGGNPATCRGHGPRSPALLLVRKVRCAHVSTPQTGFPFWPSRIRTTLHPRPRCVHLFRRPPFTASKTAVMTRSNVKLRRTASVSRHFSDTFPTLLRFFARFPRERSPV